MPARRDLTGCRMTMQQAKEEGESGSPTVVLLTLRDRDWEWWRYRAHFGCRFSSRAAIWVALGCVGLHARAYHLPARMSATTIHWFRKGLRLHDNAALLEACKGSKEVYPVFIIDPIFANPEQVGMIRYRFLLQSLTDLDTSLRRHGSRLFVVRGDPVEQFPALFEKLNVTKLTFETDTEPYARKRDAEVWRLAAEAGVTVVTMSGHTMRDPEAYVAKAKGKVPIAYQPFVKLFNSLGPLPEVLPTVDASVLPPCGSAFSDDDMTVPTLEEMGYDDQGIPVLYPGGETVALERLQVHIARKQWIATFEKPKTSPNALEPATTVLSPYLKFGCLSPRLFYHKLQEVYQSVKNHSQPPVSLVGQLLWREFFYLCGYTTPNFDKMIGNPVCKQIPWQRDPEMLAAWKEARTGYPFIDAIMTQLRTEGWIHHLARHAVACFLTRGDLYQSWEEGVKVFDIYLIDGDWSLNNGNWLWLSASAFFYQFFRVYSPVAFGQKTDPDGAYIRKYLPQLRKFPKQFIYQPWKAPKSLQESCGCIIGRDYPLPIVKHEEVSKVNTGKMKQAYDDNKAMAAGLPTSGLKGDFDGEDKEKGQTSATKRKNFTKPTKSKRSKATDLLPGQQKLEF